jgi:hypothetical protein
MKVKDHIEDSVALLEQAISLVARLDNNIFTAITPISPRGSIGGHLRHTLNFYQSFLSGCEEGRVDYNARIRDARFENDRLYALSCIEGVIHALRSVSHLGPHDHLLVRIEDDVSWCRSSILRELDSLKSHTIHHYSLIAMLLRLHEFIPGDEFGVAPSTLRHWKQEALCAQ